MFTGISWKRASASNRALAGFKFEKKNCRRITDFEGVVRVRKGPVSVALKDPHEVGNLCKVRFAVAIQIGHCNDKDV